LVKSSHCRFGEVPLAKSVNAKSGHCVSVGIDRLHHVCGGRTAHIVFGGLASEDNDEIDAVGPAALKLTHG
jgi:hypothetical protein